MRSLYEIITIALLTCSCGSATPSPTPAAPPPAPAPAAPAKTYTVTGSVTDLTGALGLAAAGVAAIGTTNAGKSAVSDTDGHYTLSGLTAGVTTLRATASGYVPVDVTVTVPSDAHASFKLPSMVPPPGAPLQCDPALWPHMHDVQRIKVARACVTVTGTIASASASDDGDVDMQLTLDPAFSSLLNAANVSKLNGNLQIEAICQEPVHADVPDAQRTCAGFSGRVPLPAVGTRVQVTGVYVLDSDHGWMEVHPISVLTLAP